MSDSPTMRLFQVHVRSWSPPLMVAAETFENAMAVARRDSLANAMGVASIVVIDATDQFVDVSARMRRHTETLCLHGVSGVVEYDDTNGWYLRDQCGA